MEIHDEGWEDVSHEPVLRMERGHGLTQLGTAERDPRGTALKAMKRVLARISAGGMAVVMNEEVADRRGALVMAAERADASALACFARMAGGAMSLAVTDKRWQQLGLAHAVRNDPLLVTPSSVHIAARNGSVLDDSIADRAHTVAVALDPERGRGDIVEGGHIHATPGRLGGVLQRRGWPEAAIDLARLARLYPAGLVGEIVLKDPADPHGEDVVRFAMAHRLPIVTIDDVVTYRWSTERLVRRIVSADLPIRGARYKAVGYQEVIDRQREHLALVHGDIRGRRPVLVYIHARCWEGDVFRSTRCDCRERLDEGLAAVAATGRGVIVHVARNDFHVSQTTAPAETIRAFGASAQILADLGVGAVRLLSCQRGDWSILNACGMRIHGYPANG
jgi:3,4-dihydroxy 2-butanone 4-phosphate synthase/GTP cyclohydrolase II